MSENSVAVQIDVEAEITAIIKKLDTLHDKAPNVLKNAINATARKVRTQMVRDAQGRYAIKDKDALKNEAKGGPKVYTAKVTNLTAEIKSRGPMQDIMAFMTKPNSQTGAAAAKVLNSGTFKPLEINGLKAFVTKFASGHVAIVQRRPPMQYSRGRAARASKYGSNADMTKVKKLLSPAVPHLLGNEEIRASAEKLAYETLQAEIQTRIDKINDASTW